MNKWLKSKISRAVFSSIIRCVEILRAYPIVHCLPRPPLATFPDHHACGTLTIQRSSSIGKHRFRLTRSSKGSSPHPSLGGSTLPYHRPPLFTPIAPKPARRCCVTMQRACSCRLSVAHRALPLPDVNQALNASAGIDTVSSIHNTGDQLYLSSGAGDRHDDRGHPYLRECGWTWEESYRGNIGKTIVFQPT